MLELEISGKSFRIEHLDAMKQFHVSRKLAPVLPSLLPIFMALQADAKAADNLDTFAKVLQPLADAMSELSDANSEYIMATCLSVVKCQVGSIWVKVWDTQFNTATLPDIDLSIITKLVMEVIKDSLGPFMAGLLTSQQAGQTTL